MNICPDCDKTERSECGFIDFTAYIRIQKKYQAKTRIAGNAAYFASLTDASYFSKRTNSILYKNCFYI